MYWDDRRFSRFDLAKQKFGGPFTTKEVEDVKTFFKILVVVILGSSFAGLCYDIGTVANSMMYHYQDQSFYGLDIKDCSHSSRNLAERVSVYSSFALIVTVLVPLFEIIIYPILWKCMPRRLGIMEKFVLGMILQFFFLLSLLLLEVIGHQVTPSSQNVTCLLHIKPGAVEDGNVLSLSFKWLVMPAIFSIYFLLIATIEFVTAQTPYSMKGLVMGEIYLIVGLSVLLVAVIKYSVHVESKPGCGIWYFLTVSVITAIMTVMACGIVKSYKKRRRDENNKHVIVDDYPNDRCIGFA